MLRKLICLAIAAAAIAPSFAQTQTLPPTDGKAALKGKAADHMTARGAAGVATRTDIRALMTAVMDDLKVAEDEKDFLAELAAGAPVSLKAGGKTIAIPAMAEELRQWPRMLVTPPNLHQLWHAPAPGGEMLVEMSRWAPAMHQRIYTFIGNQLDDAWKKSNLLNAYAPYVSAIGSQWKSFETLPADPEMRKLAYDLLTTGVAYGIEKATNENREPPKEFLYAWITPEDTQQKFIDGNQRRRCPYPLNPQRLSQLSPRIRQANRRGSLAALKPA
jgi:hypothetical protein